MCIPVLYTPGAAGSLAIVDSLDNIYYLPPQFKIRTIPSSKMFEPIKVAFAHGAKDVSDGKHKERIIEVYGELWAEDDASYRILWDEIAAQFLGNEDFWLRAGTRQIKIKRTVEFPENYQDGSRLRYGDFSAQLLALDPFWNKTTAEITELITAGVTPYDFSFNVGGTVECHPVILVTCAAANVDFKIEHLDDNRWIRIQHPSATVGSIIEIDCVTGEVTLGGVNILQYVTGLFPRLLPNRDNYFEYTGASATIRFTYRWAWL